MPIGTPEVLCSATSIGNSGTYTSTPFATENHEHQELITIQASFHGSSTGGINIWPETGTTSLGGVFDINKAGGTPVAVGSPAFAAGSLYQSSILFTIVGKYRRYVIENLDASHPVAIAMWRTAVDNRKRAA